MKLTIKLCYVTFSDGFPIQCVSIRSSQAIMIKPWLNNKGSCTCKSKINAFTDQTKYNAKWTKALCQMQVREDQVHDKWQYGNDLAVNSPIWRNILLITKFYETVKTFISSNFKETIVSLFANGSDPSFNCQNKKINHFQTLPASFILEVMGTLKVEWLLLRRSLMFATPKKSLISS